MCAGTLTASSSASKWRERLFARGKPHVRPFALKESDGALGGDLRYLWAAYRAGMWPELAANDESEFVSRVVPMLRNFHSAWIVEDASGAYSSGRGPVAVVCVRTDGWRIEPSFTFFKWITLRGALRVIVAFLQMVKYARDVGVCVIRCGKAERKLWERMQKYGVLFAAGRIRNGLPEGDEFLFAVNGRRGIREKHHG